MGSLSRSLQKKNKTQYIHHGFAQRAHSWHEGPIGYSRAPSLHKVLRWLTEPDSLVETPPSWKVLS